MSALIHKAHLLPSVHTEDAMPAHYRSFKSTGARSASPLAPAPASRDVRDSEDGCLYPKRFSRDRKQFFTTNTKGEVVEISKPAEQFKSLLRSSKREARDEEGPRARRPALKHETLGYEQIPCLAKEDYGLDLAIVCDQMIESKTHRESIESDMCDYLVYRVSSQRRVREHRFYNPIKKSERNSGLIENTKLTFFHAYNPREWSRVKSVIMEIIRCYQLEAILKDSAEGYGNVFENQNDFVTADNLLGFTIFSLIHFAIFKKRSQELYFWKKVSQTSQKTKFIINYLDSAVFGLMSRGGKKLAESKIIQHHFPDLDRFDELETLDYTRSVLIKCYTKGEFIDEANSEHSCWAQILYARAKKYYKREYEEIRTLESIVEAYKLANSTVDEFCFDFGPEEEEYAAALKKLDTLRKRNFYADAIDYTNIPLFKMEF